MSAPTMAMRLLVAAILFSTAWADVEVPPLVTRVTDQTGTLSADQKQALEQRLAAFEASKGSQIAILIVPTTQPETIEQYSIRVAERWKLGRKGIDDGALLLIARNDRRVRIEVGYGLEGALTDVTSERIINEIITPRFKNSDYYGGISAGVDKMTGVINGEPLPPPATNHFSGNSTGLTNWLFPLLFFSYVAAGIFNALLGRVGGASLLAVLVGVVIWVLLGTLVSGLLAAVIAFVVALIAGERHVWSSRNGAYLHSGGWGAGSSGGGFGSGGGSFGGGGGSFGGGGASGSW